MVYYKIEAIFANNALNKDKNEAKRISRKLRWTYNNDSDFDDYSSCEDLVTSAVYEAIKNTGDHQRIDQARKAINDLKITLNADTKKDFPGYHLFLVDYDERSMNFYGSPAKEDAIVLTFMAAVEPEDYRGELLADVRKFIINRSYLDMGSLKDIVLNEIGSAEAKDFAEKTGFRNDNIIKEKLYLDTENCSFRRNREEAFTSKENFAEEIGTLEEATKKAKALMADKYFIEELGRIYDSRNSRDYLGNPIHYCIQAQDDKVGKQLAEILIGALYANGRIASRRNTVLENFSADCNRYSMYGIHNADEELDRIFIGSHGCTVIVNLNIGYNNDQQKTETDEIVEIIKDGIVKNKRYTLSIILGSRNNAKSAEGLRNDLERAIDFVTVGESEGNKTAARKMMTELLKTSDFKKFIDKKEIFAEMDCRQAYSPSDVMELFERFNAQALRSQVYPAYIDIENDAKKFLMAEAGKDYDPYEKLQEMVGLSTVKKMVDDIIASIEISELRKKNKLPSMVQSRHMFFEGAPGTAKTTVARLLGEILYKKGLIEEPIFKEVGRSDLVGMYVGHTAPKVKAAFRKARGGILFIDEAYSLCDGNRGYGKEAVATIVQEMENNRDNTIVIFAGYKEDMEKLLDYNEGLRSRIGFSIDFPDYSADELVEITKLMVNNNKYILDDGAIPQLRKRFIEAAKSPRFGNGRYARSLFEHAARQQARRLSKEGIADSEDIAARLQLLKAEDFADDNISLAASVEKHKPMGFAV